LRSKCSRSQFLPRGRNLSPFGANTPESWRVRSETGACAMGHQIAAQASHAIGFPKTKIFPADRGLHSFPPTNGCNTFRMIIHNVMRSWELGTLPSLPPKRLIIIRVLPSGPRRRAPPLSRALPTCPPSWGRAASPCRPARRIGRGRRPVSHIVHRPRGSPFVPIPCGLADSAPTAARAPPRALTVPGRSPWRCL